MGLEDAPIFIRHNLKFISMKTGFSQVQLWDLYRACRSLEATRAVARIAKRFELNLDECAEALKGESNER